MRILPISLAAAILLASFGTGAAPASTLAIVGGTVHPVSGEPYRGAVVVEDGTIVAAGPDASAPTGAKVIDAEGLHVYPGLMDAMGQIGTVEIGAISATDDRAEMGMYNAHLEAATAIHPASELIRVARSNGLTHAVVAPLADGDGVVSGRATLVDLTGWTVEEMTVAASVAMVFDWPAIVTRRFDFSTFSFKESAFNDAKEEAQKKQNELRDWLDAARQYRKARGVDSPRAERNLPLEHLARCLDGGMPVVIQANAKRDIEAAVKFAESEGLRMILGGGRDAHELKEMLVEKDIPVLLGAVQTTPREEDDPYDRPYAHAGELVEAGIVIGFGSGVGGRWSSVGAHSARTLPYEAATAVAFGLSEDDALKALTLWPAKILGVDDQLGSIEVGKRANLIVTDGSPLALTTDVRHLIIAGEEVSTSDMHRELYEKYRSRPGR